MIGAITGDVLGSVYEGAMIKRKDFRLFNALNRPTDDSVLTLAVADAILRAYDAPIGAVLTGAMPTEADFAACLRETGRRYPRAGYGGSFRRWMEDSTMGPYQSWGNGSAMRASAVGWAYENVEDVLRVAELSARPTHDHHEGIKGAQAVALAVFLARHGASRENLRLEIARRFGYDLGRTVEEIRPGYAFEISCQHSVPESIVAFLDSTDFEDTIRNAISLGGDADTQACIAGAIAEAFYGGVPESMLAWVLPRLDSSQLRIVRAFAGRFMTTTRAVQSIDRLIGDRLPGGLNASEGLGRVSSRGPEYRIVLSGETWSRLEDYAGRLGSSRVATPGRSVAAQLEILTRLPGDDDGSATREPDRQSVTPAILLDALLNSKRPRCFAESEVRGDGSDWTPEELSLLGDIGVAVPVTVYDDGRHSNPRVHEAPFAGTLLFVPGALLRADSAEVPPDWDSVVRGGAIDQDSYAALYERRLVPLLSYASARALAVGRKALVTIPGLGCGQFSGRFHGSIGAHLRDAIREILKRHIGELRGVRAIWFDPYSECENERDEIGSMSYLVRPLLKNDRPLPQLCVPTDYEEPGDDFADCDLFSVVAWDHASWPGNDFYAGARSTDDGVKAAATDTMRVMTGFAGSYNRDIHAYEPPADASTWESLVRRHRLRIAAHGVTVVVGRVGGSSGDSDLEEIDDGAH